MAVTLNERGYVRARELIEQGRYVLDGRHAWSEHQPLLDPASTSSSTPTGPRPWTCSPPPAA